ncbi:MAG: hypothetical protein ACT4OE_09865 [Sphingosinicella sp.]
MSDEPSPRLNKLVSRSQEQAAGGNHLAPPRHAPPIKPCQAELNRIWAKALKQD